MYAVVGCSDCSALWVVEGRPETTRCPRCQSRHQFGKLKQFVTTDTPEEAKEARAAMLADRQDQGDAFENLDHFAVMERDLDSAGVDDDTYLDAQGVDTEDVAAAGERASEGAGGSRSRKEIVRGAIEEREAPTEADVLDYATEHGVPEAAAERLLTKLVRAGEAIERDGTYRLV
jgi:DNA-directed RNA polymerase subunit RPC12/RpoP